MINMLKFTFDNTQYKIDAIYVNMRSNIRDKLYFIYWSFGADMM